MIQSQETCPRFIGSYRLVEFRAEGASALVYAAESCLDEQRVLIKISKTAEPALKEAFRREFAVGSRLRHPNLGSVLDWGELPDGRVTLVLSDIKGCPLAEQTTSWSEEAIFALGFQLALALGALHEAGIVHRDVAPGNVMLTPAGQAVLIDFGLLSLPGTTEAAGTLHYMAPEALLGLPLTQAADFYGLGALLYRLLCGRSPFEGLSGPALLTAIVKESPTPIDERVSEISPALASLVMRCLAKDASDRPESAREMAKILGRSRKDKSLCVWEGHFIAPSAFEAWKERALSPGVFQLKGASGSGVSRFLREAFSHVQERECRALTLNAYSQAGPYALLEALWQWGERLGGKHGLSERQRSILASLWPWVAEGSAPLEQPGELGAILIQGLTHLLSSARGGRPWVVLVNGWDAADSVSQKILKTLWHEADSQGHWLIATGLETEIAAAWASTLTPFSQEATRIWLDSCLQGESPPHLAEQLHELTFGNPGWMFQALAQGARDQDGRLPKSIEAMQARRFAGLSPSGRRVAELLAVAERPLDKSDCELVLSHGPKNAAQALDELMSAAIVVAHKTGFRFAQGWWGPWVQAHMAPEQKARVSRRLALSFEAAWFGPSEALQDAGRLAALARLFEASDNPEAAIPAALKAGRALAGLFVHEAAKGHFLAGLEAIERLGGKERHRETRLSLLIELADLRRLTGELDQAARAYNHVLNESLDSLTRGRVGVSLGKTYQMLNRFLLARETLLEALEHLPQQESTLRERLRALTTLGRVEYFLEDHAQSEACYAEALQLALEAGEKSYQAESLSFLGIAATQRAETVAEGLQNLTLALSLRQELQEPIGLCDAHMFLGNAYFNLGRYDEALVHFEANRQQARQAGQRQEEAFALANLALCHSEQGQVRRALTAIEAGKPLAQATGDIFLLGLFAFLEGEACMRLGDHPAMEEAYKLARKHEAALGNATLRQFGLMAESKRHLFFGNFESARRAAKLALTFTNPYGEGPAWLKLQLLVAESWVRQDQASQAAEALAFADACLKLTGARGAIAPYRHLCGWLAYGRGASEQALEHWDAALMVAREQNLQELACRISFERNGLLKEARLGSSAGAQPTLEVTLGHAESLRLPELVALGCFALAMEKLEQGADLAAERLARRGKALLDNFTRALQGKEAKRLFEAHPARAAFYKLEGLEETHRLVRRSRRLELLLHWGSELSKLKAAPIIFERVKALTIEMTQSERCLIFMEGLSPPNGPYSRTIIQQVRESRASLCVLDALQDDVLKERESILSLRLRSVMAVPMLAGETLLGLIYVDSQVALGAFTQEDLRCLEAIAAQAASALLNARLHQEIKAQLEQQAEHIARLEASEGVIKNLQNLDKLRGEYFQATSHDLRAPLASISASCQLLLKGIPGPLNPEQVDVIKGAKQATRSLMALIDGILDAACLESGGLRLQARPVSLFGPIDEALRLLAPLAAAKGLALRWDEPALRALPRVLGDERRLMSVVLNLLSNAIKFTAAGNVTVEGRALQGEIELKVSDTGPGLTEERLSRLFERDGPRAEGAWMAGSGLGLWLVKGLVDLHGGRITVKSLPSEGCCFALSLPLAHSSGPTASSTAATNEPSSRVS
jgi:signal transduction histidine kinase